MHVTAIIAAGGRGVRFGGGRLKQLVEIGGRAILDRSVSAFVAPPRIDEVVVAVPPAIRRDPPSYLRSAVKPVRLVDGGERRQDSVAKAFAETSAASDVIVIHDAARPFASADLISRTIAAAARDGAAVAAIASRDTVKRVGGRAEGGSAEGGPAEAGHYVRETIPRETIYLAQTPQAFRRHVLRDALALRDAATDEAALAERAGHSVRIVEGEAANIKITTTDDLVIAEAIALRGAECGLGNDLSPVQSAIRILHPGLARIGTGYDLHRLVEGRPLVIGGITIPSDRGPLGHSDGDVVCHAIVDALLGAASLGDIGRHFPDSDARWKDAAGPDLLARTTALIAETGYGVVNVDVTVILERPKIKDQIDAMRRALAATVGVDVSAISVKGKTNEGVDAIGRGEAIAAHAVVLLTTRRRDDETTRARTTDDGRQTTDDGRRTTDDGR